MYAINYEVPAFLLSLLCYVYSVTAKRRQYIPPKGFKNKLTNQHFMFLMLLVMNMLSSVTSIVGVYITTMPYNGPAFWPYFFFACYFLSHTTLAVSFTIYIIDVTGTNAKWKTSMHVLFIVPYVLAQLFVLTNNFTSWAFYIDENLQYHRGDHIVVLYVVGVLYVILGFVFFIKNKKAISKLDSWAVGVFIVIATVGIVLQGLLSTWLVELFAEALACVILMIVLEEKSGHVDPVTGLLNRIAFTNANRKYIETKQRYDIVLLKIKDVEKIADKFGVRVADFFLMNVAQFFNAEAGVQDVFSYRREDFAVIFKEPKEGESKAFADKLLARFDSDWKTDSALVRAEALVTIVRIPDDITDLKGLDAVISSGYRSKKTGSYFVPFKDVKEASLSGVYEESLKKAIKENKLLLKYQPIWSVKEGRTVSAEALLRVDSEELRSVSPEVYIPIAEKTGLIREIGMFVFEEVCRFLSGESEAKGLHYVELNLSVYQFMYPDLVESFEKIRKRYGVAASRINLEITETAATLESDEVTKTLREFKDLGYTLSLDDFGTGYSNIVRVLGSRYENVKIDKSILWSVSGPDGDPMLLKNLMNFIKGIDSDIVQEGVETKEQLDLAISCGADFIQGYYFSKPVVDKEFIDYLKSEKTR